jgi:hypothetical protein
MSGIRLQRIFKNMQQKEDEIQEDMASESS